ncbi:MAG: hypothetical protein GY869_07510 [Planctomycetes bacterium]|nr:hypothetical protein [Planctomycetota bacterium]
MSRKILIFLFLIATLTGCSNNIKAPDNEPLTVSQSLESQSTVDTPYDPAVARVNGRAILKSDVAEILWQGRARRVLDEMVLLETVRQQARLKEIDVTDELINRQLERILQDLSPDKIRQEQLVLLDYMLASRGMTRPEFDLIVERQAILRQLVDSKVEINDQILAAEYDRQFGRKVMVRALIVSNLRLMEQAQQSLNAGESFSQVVGQMSEDEVTLSQGGIWGPFTENEQQIPAIVRQTAFSLAVPGDRSEVISYFDQTSNRPWMCMLELVQIIPAEVVLITDVRESLIFTLTERQIRERTLTLQSELTGKAIIEIIDPILR